MPLDRDAPGRDAMGRDVTDRDAPDRDAPELQQEQSQCCGPWLSTLKVTFDLSLLWKGEGVQAGCAAPGAAHTHTGTGCFVQGNTKLRFCRTR